MVMFSAKEEMLKNERSVASLIFFIFQIILEQGKSLSREDIKMTMKLTTSPHSHVQHIDVR